MQEGLYRIHVFNIRIAYILNRQEKRQKIFGIQIDRRMNIQLNAQSTKKKMCNY